MSNKLTFYSELITLNQYINFERANKYKASTIKKKLTNNIRLECFADYNSKFLINKFDKYNLIIEWFGLNRTDSDNLFFAKKFILDGIVKSGKLKDDAPDFIWNIYNVRNKAKDFKVEVYFNKI